MKQRWEEKQKAPLRGNRHVYPGVPVLGGGGGRGGREGGYEGELLRQEQQ